jgi:hypothetical protein
MPSSLQDRQHQVEQAVSVVIVQDLSSPFFGPAD